MQTGITSHLNLTLSSSADDGFTVSTLLTDNNSAVPNTSEKNRKVNRRVVVVYRRS